MSTFRRLLVTGLCLTPLAILVAQETGKRENPAGRDQPPRAEVRVSGQAGQAQSGQLDKYFVSCLRSDNEGEIAIAKLGEQRATNPEVKAFAQEMIKDHTDFLAKLDRFNQAEGSRPAGTTTRTETRTEIRRSDATKTDVPNRTDPAQPDRADKTPRAERVRDAANPPAARADVRVDTTRGDVTVQTAGRDGGITDQLLQVKQEIHDKCLASTQRELSEKEGKEFDQCFMFIQAGAHMKMVDTLTVLKSHTTGELQQTLEEGLKTAQQHLEHAKQLAKKIDDHQGAGGTVERPAAEKTTTEKATQPATPRRKDRVNK